MLPSYLTRDLAPDLYTIVRETRISIAHAKAAILDDLLDDLEQIAALPDAAPAVDEHKAPSPELVDADEFRAMVRPSPTPEPEPEEFAVVRAAPTAAPEAPPEPPKRPRRRTPPPAAPLPGPVDEAVEGASESTPDDDGFGSIPF